MQERSGSISRSIIFEEFLSLQELNALTAYTQGRQADFKNSQVFDPGQERESYRRSRVLMDAGQFHALFSERLLFYLPRILRALQCPTFEVSRVEAQITASNDGDYFHMHNDNTHANWPSRKVTFVYFFHREPRPFGGGELVLYESRQDGDAGEVRRRITPEQNSITFFQSSCLHEILPVHCPSRSFEDSRFTLNGWLHC